MQTELANWQADEDVRQRLNGIVVDVILSGPTRVMSQRDLAVPTTEARAKKLPWTMVFIRGDGWTLGCGDNLRQEAFAMWRGDWVAAMTLTGEPELVPILNGELGPPEVI